MNFSKLKHAPRFWQARAQAVASLGLVALSLSCPREVMMDDSVDAVEKVKV